MKVKSFKEYLKEFEYRPGDKESKNVIDKRVWNKDDVESFMNQGTTDKPEKVEPLPKGNFDHVLPGPTTTEVPKTTPAPKIVPPKPQPAVRPKKSVPMSE